MNQKSPYDFNADPFFQLMGITILSAENDRAVLRMNPSEKIAAGINGSVHGGAVATLVDNAGVTAVCANLQGAIPQGTADLQITYLRQCHGELEATARVIKRGRQLCTALVEITNAEGKLCASGRVLYAVRVAEGR